MKVSKQLFAGMVILSLYLISCYPDKKILGYYSNGKPQAIRYSKHHNSHNERWVSYYDNGQKQFVRYWRNDLEEVYKMKSWYKSGAKRQVGWRKDKDSIRKNIPADSEMVFWELSKEQTKGWYENGKLKFDRYTKDNMLIADYYNEQGIRTKQEILAIVRPDGYDTVAYTLKKEASGSIYEEPLKQGSHLSGWLLEE